MYGKGKFIDKGSLFGGSVYEGSYVDGKMEGLGN
jgi:hypothetical protein